MVFITAGMGGGTGTGAAPVIAQVAKEMGKLTVGIVTLPFRDEGKEFVKRAIKGIRELKKHVDSLLIIDNQKLYQVFGDLNIYEAFPKADEVLSNAVKSIAEIITRPGFINVDFADVKSVMTDRGVAHMGVGHASGDDRAELAVKAAIESPLLETSIQGAKAILLYVAGGYDLGMLEVSQIASLVEEQADRDCILIFGAAVSEEMQDEISITVIATGFDEGLETRAINGADAVQAQPQQAPQQTAQAAGNGDVIGVIDNVQGREVDLQDLLKDNDDKTPSRFDIPDFLK